MFMKSTIASRLHRVLCPQHADGWWRVVFGRRTWKGNVHKVSDFLLDQFSSLA